MPLPGLSRWTRTPSRLSCTSARQILRCFQSIAPRGRRLGSTPGTCGDFESVGKESEQWPSDHLIVHHVCLTDAQWARIEPLLPRRLRSGVDGGVVTGR
jgi:hypothetical protein